MSNAETIGTMQAGKNPKLGAAKPITLENLDELRQEYELNGFLYFPRFLPQEEIDHYIEVMYRLDKTLPYSTRRKPRKPGDPFEIRNAMVHTPEIRELIDREQVLMLVSYLMGCNIQICNTQAFIKPGFPPGTTMQQQSSIGWHTDMQRNAEAINGVLPRFTTRAGFFLTDLSRPNLGSVKIVAGSHRYAGRGPPGIRQERTVRRRRAADGTRLAADPRQSRMAFAVPELLRSAPDQYLYGIQLAVDEAGRSRCLPRRTARRLRSGAETTAGLRGHRC
jgi:hypothetical protein